MQVVTCGSVPLESSFHKVPRCVYTSTSLYEYRGWDLKTANSQHHRFTWGLRSLEVSHSRNSYIKEGSTVSVMGVVQRNDNVLMIVPPSESFSTGCQWARCILPASLEGIVLRCEDTSKVDVIPV
ncbi:hypothetical protein BHE74_00029621 [Ensete ventricosum]|uniref:Uncharacterized protein n=1 Tax=Ensete ventricosum TaxID=4639 RepID=A0A426ZPL5_ENSVE|nr:hypothetical protein B296_00024756 [Ensete ventricosum]RWW63213.1 hypothetical protein BHE74_00029621 [Ensete ventricosum]